MVAVLGAENASGEFEVKDICYPGAAPQMPIEPKEFNGSMDVDSPAEWIALVSGLNVGSPSVNCDLRVHMLVEYLLSQAGAEIDQQDTATISRLIIAGDSFAPISNDEMDDPLEQYVTVPGEIAPLTAKKASKKYDYNSPNSTTTPTKELAGHLSELSRSMIVHVVPGSSDPAGGTLPQQPFPRAMFGAAKNYESFHVETNPCWIGVGNCQ